MAPNVHQLDPYKVQEITTLGKQEDGKVRGRGRQATWAHCGAAPPLRDAQRTTPRAAHPPHHHLQARQLLEQVAKQVQPLMRRHQLRVPLLSEFYPSNPNLLVRRPGSASRPPLLCRWQRRVPAAGSSAIGSLRWDAQRANCSVAVPP